jgi:hypothetical protein
MIIGICGLIGSGKDTAADYLVNLHHFRRESFANTLKDAVAQVFSWDRTMLEGRTKHSREWREQVDTWWAERLNMPSLTPRWVLQQWGTNVLRTGFHNDIWIASLENKLRNTTDDVVITDCRFPNEINAIKAAGGIVVRIRRGDEPEWYTAAVAYNRGPNGNSQWAVSKQKLDKLGVHPSEYSWIGTDFDQILDNNGTLDHLYNQVMHLAPVRQHATDDRNV